MRALIFDSFFDQHRGVIACVRVFEGTLKPSDIVLFIATGFTSTIQEVGYFVPDLRSSEDLKTGDVGYIITGTKELGKVKVGDTITLKGNPAEAIPGFREVQPKVFASMFPIDQADFHKLRESLEKLQLSDASLQFSQETIPTLGHGFRCGFLGLLHIDIVQERITREYGVDIIITSPSVEYEITKFNGTKKIIHGPSELTDMNQITTIAEPYASIEILTPEQYIGNVIELLTHSRGIYKTLNQFGLGYIQIVGEIPIAEVIVDFYDNLKSISKGYATMTYTLMEYRVSDLVKVDFLVNHTIVPPLAIILHRSRAEGKARDICSQLKELIPRQQFEIPIQASIGSRIIARETIKAYRKDVTAKLYGGDITRRMKLLEKQKKGKSKMKMIGNVEIPQAAFLAVLKKQ